MAGSLILGGWGWAQTLNAIHALCRRADQGCDQAQSVPGWWGGSSKPTTSVPRRQPRTPYRLRTANRTQRHPAAEAAAMRKLHPPAAAAAAMMAQQRRQSMPCTRGGNQTLRRLTGMGRPLVRIIRTRCCSGRNNHRTMPCSMGGCYMHAAEAAIRR